MMQDLEFSGSSFYRFLNEKKLMGSRCRSCGKLVAPPRPICSTCFGEEIEWVEMSGKGRLAAFTTIHIGPTAMLEAGYDRKNPYCAGIVQLAEGPAVSAQILGFDPTKPEEIKIGTPLSVVFVERGEGEQMQLYLAFEASV
ncbi:MAG: Zn-ribbon domain-containing OB-fold protein [Anaerolineales bacterium]|nr:Zn-ribbon domain-containing OB-fold protein [Anaerolineales bacterium]